MIYLNYKTSVVILSMILFSCMTLESKASSATVEQSLHGSQSYGWGCDVFIPTLIREPIPDTGLKTGTFYVVRMKAAESHSHSATSKSIGYITWSSMRNPGSHKYIYADMHHDMESYNEDEEWYKDSHWAFLKSRQAGWYHLINCGYPSFYATWSDLKAENDGSGQFPFIVSPYYPGNHTKNDFLFKPVKMKEERVFRLVTKAFGDGIVSVSKTTYVNESNYLQIESRTIWEERVKDVDDRSLFVFEEVKYTEQDGDYPEYQRMTTRTDGKHCSCGKTVLFAIFVSFWTWIIASVFWFKKEVIIMHINR